MQCIKEEPVYWNCQWLYLSLSCYDNIDMKQCQDNIIPFEQSPKQEVVETGT